jgi:hypothetical protein
MPPIEYTKVYRGFSVMKERWLHHNLDLGFGDVSSGGGLKHPKPP